MSISRLDKFNICSSFTLSNDDISCLNLLYLPIIGGNALALYMMFNSLIARSSMESEEFDHTFILDLLNIEIEEFENSRSILEGIGLLSTLKNENGYVYLLVAPLSPKKFLNSNVHGLVLYSTVGEDIYNILRKKFQIKKINKNQYTDISKSFDEVFKAYVPSTKEVPDDYLVNKDSNKKIKIKNYKFNFSLFASQIDASLINGGITEEFKTLIIQTASNYSFDEADMASLFRESIDTDSYFKDKLLKRKSKVLFTYKTNQDTPKFEVKKEVPIKDEEHLAIINELEAATGEEFLTQIMGDDYSPKYLTELNELYNTINLNPSVIKVMVMYVLKIIENKNGKLDFPSVAYFKKVADDWILNGYTDVYTAYNFINGNIKPETKKKKYYNQKTIKKPGKYEEENRKKDIMEGMDVL